MTPEERAAWQEASRLFDELIDVPTADREAWIEAQGLSERTRSILDSLLQADADPDPNLEARSDLLISDAMDGTADSPLVGRTIGGWVLIEKIGEGGMATVYRCQRQVEDVVQVGAIKLLRIGLLTTEGRQRFQREKQIIAGLGHPTIARLLDAGAVEDGTPYFVLEYVDGRPIDEFIDATRPQAQQLVEMFLPICDSVAHAQRRLIVHRDIKPSNILVDAEGNPRLLDFGIARLVDEEQIAVTTTRVYTPGFAAPEQLTGGAITLATDVYGLGATLYRLLTGVKPDPVRTDGAESSSTAEPRPVPDRDLRNVLQKAMHDDPGQRYRDAAALAEDLRRWQDGRPVLATGDALTYRVRKFVERNRVAVAASLLLLLTALAGVSATVWQATIAEREAQEALAASARAEALNDFLLGIFEASEAGRVAQDELASTAELLELAAIRARNDFLEQPELQAQMLRTVGHIFMTQGRYADAEDLLRDAINVLNEAPSEEPLAAAAAEQVLARILLRSGRAAEAITLARQALNPLPSDDPALLDLRSDLTETLVTAQLVSEEQIDARELAEELHEITRKLAPDSPILQANNAFLLARVYSDAGEFAAADALLTEALALVEPLSGTAELEASMLNSLAIARSRQGMLNEATIAANDSLELIRGSYPEGHPLIGRALSNLSSLHSLAGRLEEAEVASQEALEILLATLGPDHISVGSAYNNLGSLLLRLERYQEALDAFSDSLRILDENLAPDHWRRLATLVSQSLSLMELERTDEALTTLEDVERLAADQPRILMVVWSVRAKVYLQAGRFEDAQRAAESALVFSRERYPDGSGTSAVILSRLALAAQSLGNDETARSSLADAERELASLNGSFDAPAREYIQNRTQFLINDGDSQRAVDLLERDLSAVANALGEDHPTLTDLREQAVALRTSENNSK
ncbi:MAG: tetratricopeptide repeat protein [Wenzhouxiangella sp.]|nr:tetratricopeptide repeat protein [Wenzhouxiangella sp.]